MDDWPDTCPPPLISLNQAEDVLGSPIRYRRSLGGGSINQAYELECQNHTRFFMKRYPSTDPGHFVSEFDGLLTLSERAGEITATFGSGVLRVPKPLCWGVEARASFFIMEYIPRAGSGGSSAARQAAAGTALALLHGFGDPPEPGQPANPQKPYGYHITNRIGSSPQQNTPTSRWPDFFAYQRLAPQLEQAARSGALPRRWADKAETLISSMADFLPASPKASLLHGDLWGGNMMWDDRGTPVLIDPAVYYGHHEADLAMTELFGGFTREFYRSYQELSGPIPREYHRRKTIYNLYHMLNHLNLFGASYLGSVTSLLQDIG
ncbi:fructosamine kinase family protein [Spirochaeta lutea]|uniref:fructosamine kinase family protein n=1 Tax=Spirochaeta lutea TaxID=1480694 RepID=UPI00068D24BC|nr:fructosamine kinase family protein [Spirochaeta lutea]